MEKNAVVFLATIPGSVKRAALESSLAYSRFKAVMQAEKHLKQLQECFKLERLPSVKRSLDELSGMREELSLKDKNSSYLFYKEVENWVKQLNHKELIQLDINLRYHKENNCDKELESIGGWNSVQRIIRQVNAILNPL